MSSQGVYLAPYPDTPVFPEPLDIDDLKLRLNHLLTVQIWRRHQYGNENADEWPISHTPPELQQRYRDRVARARAIVEADTPPEERTPVNEVTVKENSSKNSTPQLSPSQASSPGAEKRTSTPDTPSTPPLSSDEMPKQHYIFQPFEPLTSSEHIHIVSEPCQTNDLNTIESTASHRTEPKSDIDCRLGDGFMEANPDRRLSKKRRYSETDSGAERVNIDFARKRPFHGLRKRGNASDKMMLKYPIKRNAFPPLSVQVHCRGRNDCELENNMTPHCSLKLKHGYQKSARIPGKESG